MCNDMKSSAEASSRASSPTVALTSLPARSVVLFSPFLLFWPFARFLQGRGQLFPVHRSSKCGLLLDFGLVLLTCSTLGLVTLLCGVCVHILRRSLCPFEWLCCVMLWTGSLFSYKGRTGCLFSQQGGWNGALPHTERPAVPLSERETSTLQHTGFGASSDLSSSSGVPARLVLSVGDCVCAASVPW